MNSRDDIVIEIVGEGETDVPQEATPQPPERGVVPILVHKLCDRPKEMRVRCRRWAFLTKGPLARKVQFARRQA